MSTGVWMPNVAGTVVKIHRQPGFYVGKGDPIVEVHLSETHRLTLCAPHDGKIMACREVGFVFKGGEHAVEVTGVGTPTSELFVAYRRKDAPGHAGRIGERLIGYFGAGQVFKDIESLPPGVDFVDFIRAKLQLAFVMVVIVGPNWAKDSRLQNPHDLHREEIRTALERKLRIVPVLVHGATMPHEEDVPEDIRPLVRRHAVEVTDTRWDYDVGLVLKSVEEALLESPKRKRFLAQVPPWDYMGGWQWVQDDPPPGDPPFYKYIEQVQREAARGHATAKDAETSRED